MNFIFLLLFSVAFSNETSVEASRIINAKTNSELHNSLNLFQELKTNEELCEKRLQYKEFPVACYRKLSLQRKLGVLTLKEIQNNSKSYDEICRKAEISGQDPIETDLTEVSPKCQTYIRLALCKKSYREGLVSGCEFNL